MPCGASASPKPGASATHLPNMIACFLEKLDAAEKAVAETRRSESIVYDSDVGWGTVL